jgi:hypothetical protein
MRVQHQVRATLGRRGTPRAIRLEDHDGPDAGEPRQRQEHQTGRPAADDEQRQTRHRLQPIHAVDAASDRLRHAGDHRIDTRRHAIGERGRHHDRTGHAAVEVHAEGALGWAQVLPSEPAIATRPAVQVGLDGHQVPVREAVHCCPDLGHGPRDLVPQDGARHRRVRPLEDPSVGATDADRERHDADLARSGTRDVTGPDGQTTHAFEPDARLLLSHPGIAGESGMSARA